MRSPTVIAIAVVLACSLSACFTVIQPIVPNTAPAYDGKIRDSGIIGVLADNQILVTGFAKNTYDSLVKVYGNDFTVPLVGDAGVFDPIPGKYYHIKDKDHPGSFILYTSDPSKVYYEIDAQYAVKYLDMCDWSNSGIDPITNDPHVSPSAQTPAKTPVVKTPVVKTPVSKQVPNS